MAKILVTGGAGFIGSHLVDKLIELGHEVVVIDNLSSGKRENVNSTASFVEKDITGNLGDVFSGVEYVFHLAAQINLRESLKNPKEDARINILGSLNVIENCLKSGVRKIIFSSTGGAIYSSKAELPATENALIAPESPYGLAKFAIENYLRIVKNTKGLDYTALRFSNVYGPRQDSKGEAGVVAIFANCALAGEPLKVFGNGNQTRDFVYVKDVVDACILSMKLSGIYNVSVGKETEVNKIVSKVQEIIGDVGVTNEEAIPGELRRSCLDSGKLMAEGWKPKYGLDAGMKETVEWFRERN
jgi:UDP-glucose 4-epimerase